MNAIFLIIVGAAAGYLATRFMKVETGVVATVAIGVLGAVIGGWLLRRLIDVMGAMSGFVGAVLGAMLLIWLWRTFGPKH